jgi:type II secretory pathway pseudopilin PulG
MIKNNKKSGFTLVEVVLILIIVSIGLMAIISLALKSASLNNEKRNMFNSIFLTEEGLEIMNNIRDTNVIIPVEYNNWDLIYIPVANDQTFYKVDFETSMATPINKIDEAPLFLDSNNFYSHTTSSTSTPFTRLIMVRTYETYSEITSWVRWTGKGENYDFRLVTQLYDLSFQ